MKTISACYRLNASFKQLQPLPLLDDDTLSRLARETARAAARWVEATEPARPNMSALVPFIPMAAAAASHRAGLLG